VCEATFVRRASGRRSARSRRVWPGKGRRWRRDHRAPLRASPAGLHERRGEPAPVRARGPGACGG